MSAQCTGFRNCCATGAAGSYGLLSIASSGFLPYAPQYRFILPVAASITATRLLK